MDYKVNYLFTIFILLINCYSYRESYNKYTLPNYST